MADGKQWRIQNLPGVANPIVSPNPLFSIIFAENCMEMETTRLTGAHVPLDPPMVWEGVSQLIKLIIGS